MTRENVLVLKGQNQKYPRSLGRDRITAPFDDISVFKESRQTNDAVSNLPVYDIIANQSRQGRRTVIGIMIARELDIVVQFYSSSMIVDCLI